MRVKALFTTLSVLIWPMICWTNCTIVIWYMAESLRSALLVSWSSRCIWDTASPPRLNALRRATLSKWFILRFLSASDVWSIFESYRRPFAMLYSSAAFLVSSRWSTYEAM